MTKAEFKVTCSEYSKESINSQLCLFELLDLSSPPVSGPIIQLPALGPQLI